MLMNEKLKLLRIEQELSQKQVAAALGITASAYSNYEQGLREPNLDMLKKICIFYKVSADYLIGLED